MDMVRKLITERLVELGLNMAEVSTAIGRNPTYLHQFMKRGVPADLHERERVRLAAALQVEEDALRGPSTPKRTPPVRSQGRESLVDRSVTKQQPTMAAVPGSELYGQIDLPVFGTAQGGHEGALIVSELPVDWVGRPAVLLRVRDGYGMIVAGDSMSPEHKAGSIALVNPHLPPRLGDSCIFRSHADDGTNLAMIKEYRGQTETHWKVRQHNPARDFQIKKDEWQVVHRTVGSYFP